MNTRLLAAKVIDQVIDGQSLADCLSKSLKTLADARDRAFVQALVYGVCRYYFRLDALLSYLLQKPMKAKDSDVYALLLVGLYQLIEMRVPAHAAVAETVNASASLNKSWARGLVNAILREYLRKQESLTARLQSDTEAIYMHPSWWITACKKAWPNHWEKILLANNAHPPFALRVNQKHYSRNDYKEKIAKDYVLRDIRHVEQGLIIEPALAVEELPDFSLGAASIQDGAAQLSASLLSLQPGQRVLDACAAPGGKLTHILECEPDLAACVAVEKDAIRMVSIKENLQRLKLSAECICADVAQIEKWWDGKAFERILLDAPCSASGVVRRHPDIKLLRQPQDIKALAKEQLRLLRSLWPLLAPGGILLYVTCSIFPEENTQVIQSFLKAQADAISIPIKAEWGVDCEVGRQVLPGQDEMDGFYYAILCKGK